MKTFCKPTRMGQPAIVISFILLLSGCVTPRVRQAERDAQGHVIEGAASNADGTATDASIKDIPVAKTNDLDSSGSDLAAIPIEVNRLVLQWIDYFQGRGREHMERYLSRSTRYIPKMKEILKKKGMPEDLIYIALIESGFSSAAKSTANAVGYWQFIRGTGKRYGLQIDNYVDERRDFIKSTEAAADYLSGLYNLFGSWYLAIASYNVGENRVKNMVMKYHTRDFWKLAREGKLPQETIHYIPKFTAARLIAKDPAKYGFTDVDYQPGLEYNEFEVDHAVDLRKMAKEMEIDYDEFHSLNPAFKKGVAFEKRGGKLKLRVPPGTLEKATLAAANSSVKSRAAYAKVTSDDDITYYRIRSGDSLSSIAKKFGTSARKIRSLNGMGLSSSLIAGKRIKVPGDSIAGLTRRDESERESNAKERTADKKQASSGNKRSVASNRSENRDQNRSRRKVSQRTENKVYIVRRGDTLMEIARRYNVTLSQLTAYNQLKRRSKLAIGTRLAIPD